MPEDSPVRYASANHTPTVIDDVSPTFAPPNTTCSDPTHLSLLLDCPRWLRSAIDWQGCVASYQGGTALDLHSRANHYHKSVGISLVAQTNVPLDWMVSTDEPRSCSPLSDEADEVSAPFML